MLRVLAEHVFMECSNVSIIIVAAVGKYGGVKLVKKFVGKNVCARKKSSLANSLRYVSWQVELGYESERASSRLRFGEGEKN